MADGAARLTAEPGAVESAVTAAVLADRDPATDPDVQLALTMQTLAGDHMLSDKITAAALDRLRDTCVIERDSIVTTWRKVYDKAAATLTRTHQRIGDHDLTDTTPILAEGGDIAEVWAEAQNAAHLLDTVLTGWVNLMMFLRVSLDPAHRPLKIADLTHEQWLTLPAKLDPWGAVRAGLTLTLPTLDEYRARVARLQQAQIQLRASEEQPVDGEREANKRWAAKMSAGR